MRELLQALAFVALPVLTWWMIRVVIPELEERMRGRQPIESKEEVKMGLIQLYFHCEDTKRWCLKMIEELDNMEDDHVDQQENTTDRGAKMDEEEEK